MSDNQSDNSAEWTIYMNKGSDNIKVVGEASKKNEFDYIKAYNTSIWKKAVLDAESDVMRTVATIPGGRLIGESLMEYVERVNEVQNDAVRRWKLATEAYDIANQTTYEIQEDK